MAKRRFRLPQTPSEESTAEKVYLHAGYVVARAKGVEAMGEVKGAAVGLASACRIRVPPVPSADGVPRKVKPRTASRKGSNHL